MIVLAYLPASFPSRCVSAFVIFFSYWLQRRVAYEESGRRKVLKVLGKQGKQQEALLADDDVSMESSRTQ